LFLTLWETGREKLLQTTFGGKEKKLRGEVHKKNPEPCPEMVEGRGGKFWWVRRGCKCQQAEGGRSYLSNLNYVK